MSNSAVSKGPKSPRALRIATSKNINAIGFLNADSPGFLLSILDASPDCIKVIDIGGDVIFMNRNGQCAMEIDDFEDVKGRQWCDLWPEQTSSKVRKAVEEAKSGISSEFQAFCPTAKGFPKWWDVSVTPVYDAKGDVVRIVSISRDVTSTIEREARLQQSEAELKQLTVKQAHTLQELETALETAELAIKEVDHRVKNSLQMIKSMLNLHASNASSEDVRLALQNASASVASVARVHERLYKDGEVGQVDFASYLTALCADITQPAKDAGITVTVTAKAGRLSADRASALGLAISELVTNSIKHAFDDKPGSIEILYDCDVETGHQVIEIKDDGRGLPDDFAADSSAGLGMRLVSNLLKSQDYNLEVKPADGAHFVIRS